MSTVNKASGVRFGTVQAKLTGNRGQTAVKEDRRVGRTRKLLQDALHDLIVEKSYEAVTVQDIIDRANVGRSTFYAHYTNKKELLFGGFRELEAQLIEQQRLVRARSTEPVERVFGFSLAMFQHAHDYKRIWGAMVGKQSAATVLRKIQHILEQIVGREIIALAPRGSSPAVPPALITRYVVNSLVGVLTWWMDEGSRYSAEEVDHMFRVLTKPGIAAALRPGAGH